MEMRFEILRTNRINILQLIDNLSLDQLNIVPEDYNNSIAWNIAHILVVQQLLCYKLSNVNVLINDELILNYQKGTLPKIKMTQQVLDLVKKQLIELVDQFKKDYDAKIFKEYRPYHTSANITLTTIDEAIEFNNFHEGIHLGYILNLLKKV
jgi:hypothetical protein